MASVCGRCLVAGLLVLATRRATARLVAGHDGAFADNAARRVADWGVAATRRAATRLIATPANAPLPARQHGDGVDLQIKAALSTAEVATLRLTAALCLAMPTACLYSRRHVLLLWRPQVQGAAVQVCCLHACVAEPHWGMRSCMRPASLASSQLAAQGSHLLDALPGLLWADQLPYWYTHPALLPCPCSTLANKVSSSLLFLACIAIMIPSTAKVVYGPAIITSE